MIWTNLRLSVIIKLITKLCAFWLGFFKQLMGLFYQKCADVPKSAVRKADRGMPTLVYFFRISRTTFRGQSICIHVLSLCPEFFFYPTILMVAQLCCAPIFICFCRTFSRSSGIMACPSWHWNLPILLLDD